MLPTWPAPSRSFRAGPGSGPALRSWCWPSRRSIRWPGRHAQAGQRQLAVFAREELDTLRTAFAQALIRVSFLAYRAADMLHAIALTLVRLVVTQRRLLEWETAATAMARGAGHRGIAGLRPFLVEMAASPIVAVGLGITIAALRPANLPTALPLLGLWLVAPGFAYLLSRPVRQRVAPALSEPERQFLQRTARKSWGFFEDFMGPDDNWLPPDNVQEQPGPNGRREPRTRPTNIGVGLLSHDLAAHDSRLHAARGGLVSRLERQHVRARSGPHRALSRATSCTTGTTRARSAPLLPLLRLHGGQRQPGGHADGSEPGAARPGFARVRSVALDGHRRRRRAARRKPRGSPLAPRSRRWWADERFEQILRQVQEALADPADARRRVLLANAAQGLRRALDGVDAQTPGAEEMADRARRLAADIESRNPP